jgi:transposase-like protein
MKHPLAEPTPPLTELHPMLVDVLHRLRAAEDTATGSQRCAAYRPTRGQFPTEQAALKVLYLAVRNLDEYRAASVGLRSSGWKKALQAFTIYFDGRIPTP